MRVLGQLNSASRCLVLDCCFSTAPAVPSVDVLFPRFGFSPESLCWNLEQNDLVWRGSQEDAAPWNDSDGRPQVSVLCSG